MRYKTSIPDVNFLYLASIILQDAKGELPPNFILDHDPLSELNLTGPIYTGSTPWLEQYLPDIVEFVADVHTLGKVTLLIANAMKFEVLILILVIGQVACERYDCGTQSRYSWRNPQGSFVSVLGS